VTRTLAQTHGISVNVALLLAILAHNLTYPLSAAGGLWPAAFYAFYASMFTAAVWAMTPDRLLRAGALASGISVIFSGLLNSYTPSDATALAVFVTSIAYHAVMVIVLALYTFRVKVVLGDVVLAATSLYLVIGSGFAAIYALVEWLVPGSFVTSSGAPVTWQLMVYFSYVTLTTVGYGDMTPVGPIAQAFAAFEAVLGVLYTVILLSRLVGLHAAGNKDE
jgi:hypothetical protein